MTTKPKDEADRLRHMLRRREAIVDAALDLHFDAGGALYPHPTTHALWRAVTAFREEPADVVPPETRARFLEEVAAAAAALAFDREGAIVEPPIHIARRLRDALIDLHSEDTEPPPSTEPSPKTACGLCGAPIINRGVSCSRGCPGDDGRGPERVEV